MWKRIVHKKFESNKHKHLSIGCILIHNQANKQENHDDRKSSQTR